MIALLYAYLLLEEVCDDLVDDPTKRNLLRQINETGPEVAAVLNLQVGNRPLFGTIKRRTWWAILPFGGKKLRIYRLDLYHSLWLSEDGRIYRGYEDLFGSSYFMGAELIKRDKSGLQRVLDALQALVQPPVPTI